MLMSGTNKDEVEINNQQKSAKEQSRENSIKSTHQSLEMIVLLQILNQQMIIMQRVIRILVIQNPVELIDPMKSQVLRIKKILKLLN